MSLCYYLLQTNNQGARYSMLAAITEVRVHTRRAFEGDHVAYRHQLNI